MAELYGLTEAFYDESDDDEQGTNGEESAEESVLEPEDPE